MQEKKNPGKPVIGDNQHVQSPITHDEFKKMKIAGPIINKSLKEQEK